MKKLILFLGICGLWACRPEPLLIEIDPLEPQVVVFSQIIPNEFMTVVLTNTISALEFSQEEGDSLNQNILDQLLVDNATVTIDYRGQTDTLFEVERGVYISISTPQFSNEDYTLNVVTKEEKKVIAQSTMLPFIPFDEIKPVIERSQEDSLVTIQFKFTDPPEDNWYMLNFYTNGQEEADGVDIDDLLNDGTNVLKKVTLLSDIAFDGEIIEGTIELPNISETDSLVVTLSNINQDYYDFLDIRKNSTNFFTELTKEPVSLPTNVEGGLGFFNTHFPDIHLFDLNEY